MAARRAMKKPYRIAQGGHVHDVNEAEFTVAVKNGYACRSTKDDRLAHVNARYEMHVEHQTGRMLIRLSERPEVDPAGVPSWWPLIERHAFYYGAANETLFAWHDQTVAAH